MDAFESRIHQVLVKLLDGKHSILNFNESSISASALKHRIQTLTSIPSHLQVLVFNNSRILHGDQTLTLAEKFPVTVHLLLRLRGGKGGFGSLLRGAATKAGQKKTNNFDACRDMSGRRLRHVNAEKKLEEWRAGAEERKLEKMAEEFLKKKAKEVAKSGKKNGGDSTEKYVAKYRADSAKCMEEVERSVRESVKGLMDSKRKNLAEGNAPGSKRLKIWLGKRKMDDSDGDSEDLDEDDSDEENEKSIILDNGSNSDTSKEADDSSGSITEGKLVGSVDQGPSESGSDGVDNVAEESLESDKSIEGCPEDGNSKNLLQESLVENEDPNDAIREATGKPDSPEVDGVGGKQPVISSSGEEATFALASSATTKPVQEESKSVSSDLQNLEEPLNLDEYHSAAELEVLGLDRLKLELQARGLKCGGTLQERAARLFLLKTTPLEMLPKKLFAKK